MSTDRVGLLRERKRELDADISEVRREYDKARRFGSRSARAQLRAWHLAPKDCGEIQVCDTAFATLVLLSNSHKESTHFSMRAWVMQFSRGSGDVWHVLSDAVHGYVSIVG